MFETLQRIMKLQTHIYLHCIVASIATMLFVSCSVHADTVSISNSIHVTSSSGGNVVIQGSSGEPGADGADGTSVSNGTSVNSVSVRTIINGEIAENYTSTSSTPITYQHSIAATSASTNASSSVRIRATLESYEKVATSSALKIPKLRAATSNATISADARSLPSNSFIKTLFVNTMAYVFSFFSF